MTVEARSRAGWRGIHLRLYDWVLHWAGHRHARPALFLIAMAESSVFPLPPDLLLIAMTVARPRAAVQFASLTTAGSVLGGIIGYAIGWGLWQTVGDFFFRFLGPVGFTEVNFLRVQTAYQEYAFWAVFSAGFTPIPYKVFTIAAGAFEIGLPVFLLASLLGRSTRFFLVAGLVGWLGPPVKPFIERHLGWLSLAFMALLITGFLILARL